jgi:hypothetical protein
MRIFPNQDSCLRLVTALAMEMREEWMGRRSLIFKDEGAAKKMEDLRAASCLYRRSSFTENLGLDSPICHNIETMRYQLTAPILS